jgi:diacylglycerol kinase family enzyme
MLHTPELSPKGAIDFLNPCTTDADEAAWQAPFVHEIFGIRDDSRYVTTITESAEPKHMANHMADETLVYSSGGDHTINLAIAAIIGSVEDDPQATAENLFDHTSYARHVLFVAGAGGNARNFALSALGDTSSNPGELRRTETLGIGWHRPMLYEVIDEQKEVVRSGIATTTIGVNLAARVAIRVENEKQAIKSMSRRRRLAREFHLTADEMLNTPPFSAAVTVRDGKEAATELFDDITGFEVLGSRIYAKQGRAPESVNVDTTEKQLIIARHHRHLPMRVVSSLGTAARLRTGRHRRQPIDFANNELALRLTSDQPVPFHSDGEVGDRYQLFPGQTLTLKLGRIAVPVLMQK